MDKQATCQERIKSEFQNTMETLTALWELYQDDPEAYHDDYGNFEEYGLAFDYVGPETFNDQEEGYFRYQLSWGGPSDEFRFYANKGQYNNFIPYRIEYWFLDWFDGASLTLYGDDKKLLTEIFGWFDDCMATHSEYEKWFE